MNATFDATLAPGVDGAAIEFCGTEGREITLDHVDNFLDCIRTRKLPNGDVMVGHRSAQASHLGNISYVEKRRIRFDPVREEILPM
jgi:hypothetical protein